MTLQYLLDTCVISEFVKPNPEPKVIECLNAIDPDQVFLSAVTIGEIQFGISNRPPSNRRTVLGYRYIFNVGTDDSAAATAGKAHGCDGLSDCGCRPST
jgi:predicted nucleic acid-binding protein